MVVALAVLGALFGGGFGWPSGDGEVAGALATGDAATRAAAALAIGRDDPAGAAARLQPALHDRDAGVRLVAARLLLRRGSAEGLAAITAWLGSPSAQDRTLALVALREATELTPAARHGVERVLADGDVPARVLALDVLAAHPAAGQLSPLLRALDDDERGVRLRAVRALAAARDPHASLALLARIGDADRQVRAEAVSALADVADARVVPALRRLLDDPSSDLRGDAATALGRLHAEPALPSLSRLAARWPRDELGRRALVALGQLASPPAMDTLVAAAHEPVGGADVRLAFLAAGPRAVPTLIRELDVGTTTSASLAAATLGELGERSATAALVATLARPDVAVAAAEALARLGDPAGVAGLIAAASTEAPSTRTSALEALAALADPRAHVAIAPGLASSDARVRAAACRLAFTLDAGDAALAIARRLEDPSADVRLAADAALARVARPSPELAAILAATLAQTGREGLGEALARATDARAATVIGRAYVGAATEAARAPLARALATTHASAPLVDAEIIARLTRDLAADEPLARAAAEALATARLSRTQGDAVATAFARAAPAVKVALAPALARLPTGAAALTATANDPDEGASVRDAASRALETKAETPARWTRARLVAADGTPLPARKVQVVVGAASRWTTTDFEGRVRVTGLPAGPATLTVPSE